MCVKTNIFVMTSQQQDAFLINIMSPSHAIHIIRLLGKETEISGMKRREGPHKMTQRVG